jgi:hypothetical protein
MRSIAQWRAVVTSQARGFVGVPSRGQRAAAIAKASWAASSARSKVAEEADQSCDDSAPLVAADLLEDRYPFFNGRISTAPPSRAAGIRDASSIAASRSSAS